MRRSQYKGERSSRGVTNYKDVSTFVDDGDDDVDGDDDDEGDQVIYTASWWQVIAAAWNANSEADEQKVRESRYYNTLQV